VCNLLEQERSFFKGEERTSIAHFKNQVSRVDGFMTLVFKAGVKIW
jgi:hypothetical protein